MLNYFRRRQLRMRISRIFGVMLTDARHDWLLLIVFAIIGAVLGIVFIYG